MRLPRGEHAIVDMRKLVDYCLNPAHPRGRNKARVFAANGIRESDAGALRMALQQAALRGEARPGAANVYGDRYAVDFEMIQAGRTVRIRSLWIVRAGEELPQLTSCYVL